MLVAAGNSVSRCHWIHFLQRTAVAHGVSQNLAKRWWLLSVFKQKTHMLCKCWNNLEAVDGNIFFTFQCCVNLKSYSRRYQRLTLYTSAGQLQGNDSGAVGVSIFWGGILSWESIWIFELWRGFRSTHQTKSTNFYDFLRKSMEEFVACFRQIPSW